MSSQSEHPYRGPPSGRGGVTRFDWIWITAVGSVVNWTSIGPLLQKPLDYFPF